MEEPVEYTREASWLRISSHYKKDRVEGMPKISVIVPSYNQAHVLMTSLDSIFEQKNVDFEIILVDAGSNDTTSTLLQKCKDKITRLYYVTKYNLPLMVNKGVSLSTGKYISYLFPGYVYLNPYSLCQIARIAHENNFPDFIYSADNHTEEAFKSYREAFSESLIQMPSNFSIYPFTHAFLKRGFIPTSPFCMWFKAETFKAQGQLNYRYTFSKSIFDFLCRLHTKKDISTVTTYWAICNTNSNDKRVLNLGALFGRLLIIFKYYGLFTAILWFFRDKPIHIISWLLQSIRRVFKTS